MNKAEFVASLRRSMSGIEDYEYVNDTISYYEHYIDEKIRKGESEDEVLSQLGDPRLIAKSIKMSKSVASDTAASLGGEFGDRQDDDNGNKSYNNGFMPSIMDRFFNLPSVPKKILAIVGGAVGIVLACVLLRVLTPVLLIGGVAYAVYKLIKDR